MHRPACAYVQSHPVLSFPQIHHYSNSSVHGVKLAQLTYFTLPAIGGLLDIKLTFFCSGIARTHRWVELVSTVKIYHGYLLRNREKAFCEAIEAEN